MGQPKTITEKKTPMNMTNQKHKYQFPLPFDYSTLRNMKGRKLPKAVKLQMIEEGFASGQTLIKISEELGYSSNYLSAVKNNKNHSLHNDLIKIIEKCTGKPTMTNMDEMKLVIEEQQALISEYEEVILALLEKFKGIKQ